MRDLHELVRKNSSFQNGFELTVERERLFEVLFELVVLGNGRTGVQHEPGLENAVAFLERTDFLANLVSVFIDQIHGLKQVEVKKTKLDGFLRAIIRLLCNPSGRTQRWCRCC